MCTWIVSCSFWVASCGQPQPIQGLGRLWGAVFLMWFEAGYYSGCRGTNRGQVAPEYLAGSPFLHLFSIIPMILTSGNVVWPGTHDCRETNINIFKNLSYIFTNIYVRVVLCVCIVSSHGLNHRGSLFIGNPQFRLVID